MPECQAKFWTVRRGEGFNTFSIPDPKRNYDLCKRWIHNLGNEKLNIKTFVFAYHKIVCEKHFEEDCFEDDIEARLMNFKPRKKLKKGAVPTIFLDSKIPKKKETSEKRKKEKEKSELLENILSNADDAADNDETIESGRLAQKRKGETIHTGKSKKTKNSKNTVDVGIQCDYFDFENKKSSSTQCDITIEKSTDLFFCVNCKSRENPGLAISDHGYSKEFLDIPSTSGPMLYSTPVKSAECFSHTFESDELSPVKSTGGQAEQDFSYIPSDESTILSNLSSEEEDANPVEDSKFIVFWSCIKSLFCLLMCQVCKQPIDPNATKHHFNGTGLSLDFNYMNNHEFTWKSQPFVGKQPIGNIMISAATYFSGLTFSGISNFAKCLNLKMISKTTMNNISKSLVLPVIDLYYREQQSEILRKMKRKPLVICGDGRCDSPGFNAKYCTYTVMDAMTSAILDFNVVQVSETGSSSTMELEGFKRCFSKLKQSKISIKALATDRHVQIRSFLKKEHTSIKHQFDAWHLAKSICKKLLATSKKKGCEDLAPWIKSINNHIWYCACHCRGDPDLLVEMWKSLEHHICNVHEFAGNNYTKCSHPPLSAEEGKKKKWLQKGSKAHKALLSVVFHKRFLKDIRQLNMFCHTGELEVYHSMMLKYIPKRQEFKYEQMVARTQLTAIDHNFNIWRDQKTDEDGQPKFYRAFSKVTGRWTAKRLFEEKDYGFRLHLMDMVLAQKDLNSDLTTAHQEKKKTLPQNVAKLPAPKTSELVEAHISRFKIN